MIGCIIGCEGVPQPRDPAIDDLEVAFDAFWENDNFTHTMRLEGLPGSPDMYMQYKTDGEIFYVRMTEETVTLETYILTEDGERVSYGREYPDGTWLRQTDPDDPHFFEEFLDMLVWDVSEYVYQDGVYTLNDDALEEFFGEDVNLEHAFYTVVLDNGRFEIVIQETVDGDVWMATFEYEDIGTTIIELPDFDDIAEYRLALDTAFDAILEGDNFTHTTTMEGMPGLPFSMMHIQQEGDTLYFMMTVEEETSEAYFLTEEGERVKYTREDPKDTWLRQVDPDELDLLRDYFDIVVWESALYNYEEGVYTLNDYAFEEMFGEDTKREDASYTLLLDDDGFEIVIWEDFDGDILTVVLEFTSVNSTVIELPDFTPSQYIVTFETYSDDEIDPIALNAGISLDEFIPEKEGYIFMGWYEDETFEERVWTVPTEDITVHAKWLESMVQVGEVNIDYLIPIGQEDDDTAIVTGGYLMARTLTTYALWYDVRTWAEANGYHFQNQGREGSEGTDGAEPTENRLHPVTRVSWRDVIVWLNALSEMRGFNPVYRDEHDEVIRDSRDANADVVDLAIQTDNNGYRLPTSDEWEMAARWKDDTESTDGSIEVGGRWWTPGNYASGATDDYDNEEATRTVAWYAGAPGGDFTRPVAVLLPNQLGIYDMSGNVWEWTYTISVTNPDRRHIRGGSWDFNENTVRVGTIYLHNPASGDSDDGFRFVQTLPSELPSKHTVTFETYSDDEIDPVVLYAGASLYEFNPEKEGYIFMGWYEDDTFEEQVWNVPAEDITVHAKWVLLVDLIMPEMVQVGERNIDYTIPTGMGDTGTATVTGGYLMATTPTTYSLWYEVKVWAEDNGYHFQNQGREGSGGTDGAEPTENNLGALAG